MALSFSTTPSIVTKANQALLADPQGAGIVLPFVRDPFLPPL
jgi:hypothetical protein